MTAIDVEERTAAELMTTTFLTAEPSDTLGETAEKLAAADVGSALVVDYGHLVGILTSRDIVRALAARVHPSEARVREWMTAPPEAVSEDAPASEITRLLLERGFHHVPVVRAGRPIGVIGARSVGAPPRAGLGF